jgi:hypothetical protein
MLRAARPIILTLHPWTSRDNASVLKDQRAAVEESLRNGATTSTALSRMT